MKIASWFIAVGIIVGLTGSRLGFATTLNLKGASLIATAKLRPLGNVDHLPVLMPTPLPANLIGRTRPLPSRAIKKHTVEVEPLGIGRHVISRPNSFVEPTTRNIHHPMANLNPGAPQLFPPTTSQIWVVSLQDNNQPFPAWTDPNGFRDFDSNYITVFFGTPTQTGSPIFAVYVNGVKVASQCTIYPTGGMLGFNLPYTNGEFAIQVGEQNGSNNYYSNVVNPYATNGDLPGLPQSSDGCKRGQCGNDPVDVISGQLWYNYTDFTQSGPFGLAFKRSYHTSQASDTYHLQDLGPGWQDSYDAYLDLTNFAAGGTTFYDETGHFVYFVMAGPGQTVYDQLEGYTLFENSDSSGFTVTSRHGMVYTLDANGRLTKLTDRIGNTQTLTRSTTDPNQILTVTDILGRVLNFTYDTQDHIKTVTSTPSGVSLKFSYGSPCYGSDLCSVTESDGKVWNYQYVDYFNTHYNTSFHLLSQVNDPLSHIVQANTYGIDSNYNYQVQTQSTDGGLNSLSFNYPYAPDNTQTMVTDALNRVTTYEVDPIYQIVGSVGSGVGGGADVIGPLCNCGGSQGFYTAYDGFMRPDERALSDATDSTTYYTYGRDVSISFPDGTSYITTPYPEVTRTDEELNANDIRTIFYTYYPIGDVRQDLVNITTLSSVDTSGQNKVITDTYSTGGLLTTHAEQGYVGGTSQTYTTNFNYDTRGRLQQITGPRTDVVEQTTYSYYPDTDTDLARRGQLHTLSKQVTGTLSLITTFAGDSSPYNSYTVFGQPKSITDYNGVVTDFTYDANGRTTKFTVKGVTGDTTPITTSYSYDAAGKLTKLTKPLTNGITYTYDSSNRLTSEILTQATTNYQEERMLYSYDSMSQKTAQQSQNCSTPATSCSSWTTDETENYKHDGFGRVSEVDHPIPSGSKELLGYDLDGKLASVQDENHGSPNTSYQYDYAKRLTSVIQTLSTATGGQITTNTSYDVDDNATSSTDPNGNITSFNHDDFGRLRSENSPTTGITSFAYDPDRNLVTKTDANGAQTTFTYDGVNRVLTSTSTRTGFTPESVTWTYDGTGVAFGKGRLTSVSDPTGSNTFTYERRGLLKTETPTISGNSYPLGYGYDLNSNRTTLTYSNGTIATYGFDWADRADSVSYGSSQIISSAAYEPFGPLASLTFGNGTSQTISYNQRYQPTENKLKHSSTTIADLLYAEDGVGNITQIHDSLNSAYNRDFGPYDDLNRLTTANSGASLWGSATGNGYTYDNMGNIKAIQLGTAHTASLSYSTTLPKLTSVTDNTQNGGVAQSISYDAAGNQTAVGGNTYSYTPRNLLAAAGGLIYAYDNRDLRVKTIGVAGTRFSLYNRESYLLSESSLTSPGMVYYYVWLAGRPVAEVNTSNGSTIYYNFTDYMGTPEIQTSSTGSINWQAEYEPYGRVFALRSNDVHQPLRLPGQVAEQFDTGANGATTHSYNTHRWYQPSWGNYTQADPVGLLGGVNPYRYSGDNPLVLSDWLGLAAGDWNDPNATWQWWEDMAANGLNQGGVGGAGEVIAGVLGSSALDFFGARVEQNIGQSAGRISVCQPGTAAGLLVVGGGLALVNAFSGGEGGGSLELTEQGINDIEKYLDGLNALDAVENADNVAMVDRLKAALLNGSPLSTADAAFYEHELTEMTYVSQGMNPLQAHQTTLGNLNQNPFQLYDPAVVEANPQLFNDNWFNYWGLPPPPRT